MATRRIATDGSGAVAIELNAREYATIKRALAKALIRAREIGASADEHDLVRIMADLEPEAFSVKAD